MEWFKKILRKEQDKAIPPEIKYTLTSPDSDFNKNGEYIKIDGSPIPGLTLRHILYGYGEKIAYISWSPNGKYLASYFLGEGIGIWDMDTLKCIYILTGATRSIAWSPNSKMLAIFKDKNIQIREIFSDKKFFLRNSSDEKPERIAWSPNSNMVAASYKNGFVKVWNLKTKKLVQELGGLSISVPGLSWSPSGRKLAASTAWKIIVWDINSWKSIEDQRYEVIKGKPQGFFDISWSHNENILVSGDTESRFHIWSSGDIASSYGRRSYRPCSFSLLLY